MGSFRSAKARATDVATLTPAECSALEEGEWVRYMTRLPHSAAKRLADEGAVPMVDKTGRKIIDVKIKAGTMAQVKLEEGIVDWAMFDEDGKPVPWLKAKATDLIDGLHDEIRSALTDLIGGASDPDSLTDDGDPGGNA